MGFALAYVSWSAYLFVVRAKKLTGGVSPAASPGNGATQA